MGYFNEVDIWAAGVVLYSMVMGRLPFNDHKNNRVDFNKKTNESQQGFKQRLKAQITNNKFKMKNEKHSLSSECVQLIEGMLQIEPSERLTLN